MRLKKQQNHSVDFVFTLFTFLVYGGAMLMVVTMGITVYRTVAERMEQHFSAGTAQAYITEKVRKNDRNGQVFVGTVDNQNVLVLEETIKDKEYVTYIYEMDGALKELFAGKDREISLEQGVDILTLSDFSVEELEDGYLKASVTGENGESQTFFLHRDSWQKGDGENEE